MPEQYAEIRVEQSAQGVLVATLSRPTRRNAMTDQMFVDLAALQRDAATDPSVRAVVITGEGAGFCAGLDLDLAAQLAEWSAEKFLAHQERWADAVAGFSRVGVPVIAAVNGAAAGAGFGLALACDIRVAGESARFNAAFVRIGLSAGDVGASWFLPKIVGQGRASEIMFTGRFVGAEEALSIGLVSAVVPDGTELEKALEIAALIAGNSPFAMRMTKQIISANAGASSLDAALALENRTQVLATRGPDFTEALAAFRERRSPVFSS
ncbi:MAG: hypothetical protein JWR01_2409 [Subtercola sp.]|nr:hypothetical protein [Subtercola sp.]